jgi:hypothetical protein
LVIAIKQWLRNHCRSFSFKIFLGIHVENVSLQKEIIIIVYRIRDVVSD